MSALIDSEAISLELRRIQAEYQRRALEIDPDRYAPWQPAEILMRAGRKRTAAMMLNQAGVFPKIDDQCLEIGFGSVGWLGDLVGWGVPETNLHGIELDPVRADRAQKVLPLANLRVGDATALPWHDNKFRLVVASTVFTSILQSTVRRMIAQEINRVLAPGGALLWYDFAVNNPRNKQVRKVGRKELKQLFPQLRGKVESVTLAPPLARLVAPRSWTLATLLEKVPLLRTHLLAVLIKTS
jgi:ubiquinone/menaquinone biosynthesis C-methylase UbiE